MRKTLLNTAATVAGMLLASTAYADQLTLGNSTPGPLGSYDFAASPLAPLDWDSPGIGGTGTALFDGELGNYSLGAFGVTTAGPLVGGNFATNADQPFSVTLGDGDTFTGTVNWSLVKDHSNFPDLIGGLVVASASGDAAWLTSFSPGSSADMDLVLTFKPGMPGAGLLLDDLAAAPAGTADWFVIQAGSVLPRPVSEPGTLALLGMALIGWGFLWARTPKARTA
jgi:hypothetical protein